MKWLNQLPKALLGLSLTAQLYGQASPVNNSEGSTDPDEPLLINPTIPDETEGGVPDEAEAEPSATDASIFNENQARTFTITVPAPRGQILDREGYPLAQTKMAYHLALDFTAYEGEKDSAAAVAWAQERVAEANVLVNGDQSYSDATLSRHYRNRRWLPRKISQVITESQARELKEKLPAGITLLPVYLRHYPEKSVAAHLIGYVSAKTLVPTGPIDDGDPLFQSVMGKTGFEKIFDKQLSGVPGVKKIIFDKNGKKVKDEWLRKPRPGGNVVTTIDLDWQRYGERVLREGTKRGAIVVIDIQSGEVLVMASRPTFDLNEFIPYISTERYAELRDDPSAPLFARAYQAGYPPASTFKPVVTLAAITTKTIRYDQTFNCPYQIKIGSKFFRNHSRGHQGRVGPKKALAKSINPWFYQVGMKTGPQTFLSVARRLGYGSRTGLPLTGENPGVAPTPEYILKKEGRPTTDGDTANLSIGQGWMQATPLQVAQSMAAIGNGEALMQLQLVRQIQDFHGRVVQGPTYEKRNDLNLDKTAVRVTQQGMLNVVHASYGTGKRGDIGYALMCAKTGTAQWREVDGKAQNLAWFAGFLPKENPRYAFSVVYEGVPGQTVSGGRNAAPLVKRFFRNFRTEIQKNLKPAPKALIIKDEEEKPIETSIPKALIVEDDEDLEAIEPVEPESGSDPGEIPPAIPVDDIPSAVAVPEAPADDPRPEPEVPADGR